jgi:glycosyltransferase involved in cell wall biosynthesis
MNQETHPFRFDSTALLHMGRRPDRPRFSVIINNYNYEAFVGAAIASIEAQTFRDFELIVVDDGSSDRSLDIVRLHPDISIIKTERLGQARACLEAARFSQGQYIYFLDADDEAEPNLLSAVVEASSGSPAKIQFQMTPIDGSGQVTGKPFPVFPDGYDSAAMRRAIESRGIYVTPQTSGNVFSRRVFDVIDDVDYEKAIDGITLLVSPYLGEVRSISSVLARYRLHGANSSRSVSPNLFRMERTRFVDRLHHLERLRDRLDAPVSLRHRPEDMFFVRDRLFMERFHAGSRPDREACLAYGRALYRERGAANALKLMSWMLATAYGPDRISAPLADIRGNPWSRFRDVGTLLQAIFGRRRVDPPPRA